MMQDEELLMWLFGARVHEDSLQTVTTGMVKWLLLKSIFDQLCVIWAKLRGGYQGSRLNDRCKAILHAANFREHTFCS